MSSVGSWRSLRISGVTSTRWLPPATPAFRAHAAREAGLVQRFERVLAAGNCVAAHAEEREIVGRKPFKELNGFGGLADRQRRRIGPQRSDDIADPSHHRAPVGDAVAHVREHLLDRLHDLVTPGIVVDTFDMNMDDALA